MSKDKTDITELLDYIDPESFLDYEGISFKRTFGSSGSQLNLKECPRCGGRSWKVYLNADTGLGNCFHGSCVGEPGFNLFSFSKHFWGVTNGETVERLRQYAKHQGWVPKRTESSVTFETTDVTLPDNVKLPVDGKIPAYLVRRGFIADSVRYFDLRYCHKGQFIYHDHEGKRRWQNYDKRIVIPIYDLDGELRTFQGRDITGETDRKYLFPNGLPGTARFLYNAYNCIGLSDLVMCEGVFDVMATKQAFDEDVALRNVGQIGSFGKHLSHGSSNGDDQLGVLAQMKRMGLKSVTVMFDGEKSAIQSAIKSGQVIKTLGLDVRIAVLPDKCDPNEVSPHVVRDAHYRAHKLNSASLYKLLTQRK